MSVCLLVYLLELIKLQIIIYSSLPPSNYIIEVRGHPYFNIFTMYTNHMLGAGDLNLAFAFGNVILIAHVQEYKYGR